MKYKKGDRVYHAYLKCDRVKEIAGSSYLVNNCPLYLDEYRLHTAHFDIDPEQSDRIEKVLTSTTDEDARQAVFFLVDLVQKYSRYQDDQSKFAEKLLENTENYWKRRYKNLDSFFNSCAWCAVIVILFLSLGIIAIAAQ